MCIRIFPLKAKPFGKLDFLNFDRDDSDDFSYLILLKIINQMHKTWAIVFSFAQFTYLLIFWKISVLSQKFF